MKKLHLSDHGAKLGGVLSGFAHYFNKDVTVIRLLFILVTLFNVAAGVIFYIVCWVVIPQDPEKKHRSHSVETEHSHEKPVSHETPAE
jgi:phage shock protein C